MTGKIPSAELIEHGLARRPTHVSGVGFPGSDAVMCRSHVDASALRWLGGADELAPEDAVLLVGGADTEQALPAWCAACRASGEKTGVTACVVR